MSGPPQPVGSDVARDRLNQIAARKLGTLEVAVHLDADRQTLRGELTFTQGKVTHPANGIAITRANFTVVGHDRLQLADPPLSALAPIEFYALEQASALEEKIAEALRKRMTQLHALGAKMQALRIRAALEPTKLVLAGVIRTAQNGFELVGDANGVFVSRVAQLHGAPAALAAPFPVRLEDFPTAIDLELYLVDSIPKMMQAVAPKAPVEATRESASAEGHLIPVPPPPNELSPTLLAERFAGATFSPESKVELVQEFRLKSARWRFTATHDKGTTFKGRLVGPSGDKWSEKFDLTRIPGMEQVVATVLGVTLAGAEPVEQEKPAAVAAAPVAAPAVPQHLIPHPGEVWIMSVLVEESNDAEVRYTCLNIDGKPFGAARVLKRPDFEAIFSNDKGGWRLPIIIDLVQPDGVVYRQLDNQRQPRGTPKKVALGTLVENFVPEAASY